MPSTNILNIRKRDLAAAEDAEDARSLLGGSTSNDNPADVDPADYDDDVTAPRLRPSRRQSPLLSSQDTAAALAPPRTPRTTNRVRFDLAESENASSNRHAMGDEDEEKEEEEEGDDDRRANGHLSRYHTSSLSSGSTGPRAPLLTGIEAPSVTVVNTSLRVNMEELLEDVNRPKSGMLSAFMNMANSIM